MPSFIESGRGWHLGSEVTPDRNVYHALMRVAAEAGTGVVKPF